MPHDTIYLWNLIYGTNELIYKTETESHRKKIMVTKGEEWEGEVRNLKLADTH